jgi:hypothetical protein
MPAEATAVPLPPAVPAGASPAAGVRRFTREEIVRLGQSDRPWDFLPIGLAAVKAAPVDPGIRFLLAANLARLGLVTAAREHLEHMRAIGVPATDPNVVGLEGAMAALPDDRLPADQPLNTCRWNLEVLAARGIDLEPELERWKLAQSGCQWFRTLDGNLVRRRGETWQGLGDHRTAAAGFIAEQTDREQGYLYTVEGISPPWLLLELAGATPPSRNGARVPIAVVQASAQEFLDGLAHADLAAVLRDERVRIFLGPGGSAEFAGWLRGRDRFKLVGPYFPLRTGSTRCEPPVEQVLRSAQQRQVHEQASLAAEVAAIYAARGRDWWRIRFEEALRPGSPEPLRVLIPTTRYSTFLRHASSDLAEAARASGFRAEVLIEPDDQSQFAALGYLRAVRDLKPDLIVLINYTRPFLGEWVPRNLPFVCWIQDAMPHQFRPSTGAEQGPLDYLVGHLHPELFSTFGFSRERTLSMPVVASGSKFHPGPVEPGLRKRFECDVAFVSHHSEMPEAMHRRLVREAGTDALSVRILERLRPEVERIAGDPMSGDQVPRLEAATREAIRGETGSEPRPQGVTLINRQYSIPLAERILRHETLHWAAAIAERRGWRLRVFGRGWEAHERFGPFAGGPVEHGEELRACYHAAAVHLHVSITALLHQRVMECALSGGLPAARLTAGALEMVAAAVKRDVWLGATPELYEAAGERHGFIVADSPDLLRLASLRQRLGLGAEPVFWSRRINMEKLRAFGPVAPERRAEWVLGDLAQTTFRTPEELEAIIERATGSPGWRGGVSGMVAGRVRQRLTHGAFLRNVLGLVQSSLA